MRNYKVKNIFRTKLKKGDDLYYSIMNIIDKNSIETGLIIGIGAVKKANIAYFNQKKKEYENFHFDEAMEIVSLKGNISLKENKPFAHIHVSLARSDYSVVGGHLLPNTIVYACEIDIIEYEGKTINRVYDEETNLYLWDL
ncbi:DNA-binding protein [Deferribacter autotrophicus]|uniref:DNA-binding protein n=1 Tax=Deferribacter autotrophicus TaxID=500465 RepID=A0A5A8F8B1_9BACT|nr:PPC domain-containing DNA-binding protein [Deferribacter autotrophicus]KAA0259518.1 DNA-binding protein [Deferribacter autotrophicus]